MQLKFIIVLLFLNANLFSQDIKVYLFDSTLVRAKIEEFKKNPIVFCSDSSITINSFYLFAACDYDYHENTDPNCGVMSSFVTGNRISMDNIERFEKSYGRHFYIVLDNVVATDKTGVKRYAKAVEKFFVY